MESPNINRYRIRERWVVDDNGYKSVKYYPQYKSKFYGWRNMFGRSLYSNSLTPLSNFGIFFSSVLGAIAIAIGLFMICCLNFYGIVVFFSAILFMYGVRYLINITSTEGLKFFNSIDNAKNYITGRINKINEEHQKKKRKHVSKVDLPDDKIYYLNIGVERTEKLKKINRVSKLGF